MLTRCSYCSKLFAQRNRRHLVCPKAKIFIDYHGNVIAEHVPMAKWDMNKFLLTLRGRKMTWREIYWKCWGIITTMDCSVCRLALPASKRSCVCVFVHAYACVCLCVCVHVLHACVCMQTYLYAYRSIDRCLPLHLTVYVCTSMSYQVCLLDCGCMHIRYVIIGLQPDLYCFRVRALLLLPNHADIRRGVEPRRVPMLQCAGDSLRHIRPPPCTRRLLCDRPQGRYLSAAVVVGGREWAR